VSNWSSFLSDKLLNHVLGRNIYTPPVNLYFGLWLTQLSQGLDGEALGEVTAPSYSRVAVANNNTLFPLAVDRTVRNAIDIVFPEAEEEWGLIRNVAILDAATDGNILFFSALTDPKQVDTGDVFKFTPSSLLVRLK
jgi:hypothetical protein